ncbi:MAG: hypothetical protein Q8942_14630 [Bacillota bacterium]|nr:hypothetical protein [Bacillota bacterium]
MGNVKNIFLISIISFSCIGLASCADQAKIATSSVKTQIPPKATAAAYTQKIINTPTAVVSPTKLDSKKVIESWEEFNDSDFPLIASIPEKGIYLYAIKDGGVVLYINNKGHYYDWEYLTPRFILPQMRVYDYDKDGKDELAVVLYIGSGTGFSVEELHIVEISENVDLSDNPSDKNYSVPNPEYFKDYIYFPKDYITQLNKLTKIVIHNKTNEAAAEVIVNAKLSSLDLGENKFEGKKLNYESKPIYGDIAHFNIEGNKITADFALGICNNLHAEPVYVGDVNADVSFARGKFTLRNLYFKANEEYLK